ncbi:MAG: hypothetical protein HY722_03755 [Planctomycetes bacterium]|nr:hypothetical protein [Planctomycetota bacterium]
MLGLGPPAGLLDLSLGQDPLGPEHLLQWPPRTGLRLQGPLQVPDRQPPPVEGDTGEEQVAQVLETRAHRRARDRPGGTRPRGLEGGRHVPRRGTDGLRGAPVLPQDLGQPEGLPARREELLLEREHALGGGPVQPPIAHQGPGDPLVHLAHPAILHQHREASEPGLVQ